MAQSRKPTGTALQRSTTTKEKDSEAARETATSLSFTTGQVIKALLRTHGRIYQAAAALGATPATIRRFIKDYPEVAEAAEAAKGILLDTAEDKLAEAIERGEPWAVQFYLKTQGKERGYVERQEMSASKNTRLKVQVEYADDWSAVGGADIETAAPATAPGTDGSDARGEEV